MTEQEATDAVAEQSSPRQDATAVARPQGDTAVVSRDRWSDATGVFWKVHTGSGSFAAGATVASDPVTAVRATFDPHPCDTSFIIDMVGPSGGALTARRGLQAWLDGDGDELPAEASGQGAPRTGWVVVEDLDDKVTFGSADWRVTVREMRFASWMVTEQSCATPYDPPLPSSS
ncbi:hypothetical protein SAMN06264364_107134 [Quadrisphaera granulorum]|uniref:Uncharacterized protein n=1 Tax=Quadrisphaera granulorum TaxID=317664 RepID=A0A316AB36_9ACTN|nr:hypothetical protein [Quadrisphaera granulorum]PWJ54438.1 hypothetical protein BXY45_107134 [Quadrisphaera granulorum]SZE96210.1 hypothetical protein SAMN06264364_107134 [Quadrisphaera granulorum]